MISLEPMTLKNLLPLICLLLASLTAPAQIIGPDPSPPNPGNGGEGVPLDGGISLLAVAGAGYAVKRMRQLKNS